MAEGDPFGPLTRLLIRFEDSRWLEPFGRGLAWAVRLIGASVAAAFTYFAQQGWGFSAAAASILAVVAFFFVLYASRG